VLATRSVKDDMAKESRKPALEISLPGGYNWVMSGLNNDEKVVSLR